MTGKTPPDQMERVQREELARRYVQGAENWLRKLLHHQLSNQFGQQYITNGPWKNEVKEHVKGMKSKHQGRFMREIDATTFEQAIYLVCHNDYWKTLFEPALLSAYPNGRNEAKTFLERIKDIRNDVSHGDGCTARQLERAICYSNDLADSIKEFFRGLDMQREYDVPLIVQYTDNRGNKSTMEEVPLDMSARFIDWRGSGSGDLRPGDNLVAEVEIDPNFDRSEYSVNWCVYGHEKSEGNIASIKIEKRHVGEQLEVRFEIISTRDWHRQNGRDDFLSAIYRVLPPV